MDCSACQLQALALSTTASRVSALVESGLELPYPAVPSDASPRVYLTCAMLSCRSSRLGGLVLLRCIELGLVPPPPTSSAFRVPGAMPANRQPRRRWSPWPTPYFRKRLYMYSPLRGKREPRNDRPGPRTNHPRMQRQSAQRLRYAVYMYPRMARTCGRSSW